MSHVVRPAPLEWRAGGILCVGVTPQQGSKTLRKNKAGQTYMAEPNANDVRAFRKHVLDRVQNKYPGLTRLEPIFPKPTPVALRVVFSRPLLKSQEPNWDPAAPVIWCPVTPDADKLLRSVMDALTAANVWADDSQVVWPQAMKIRHRHPGALIEWRSLE